MNAPAAFAAAAAATTAALVLCLGGTALLGATAAGSCSVSPSVTQPLPTRPPTPHPARPDPTTSPTVEPSSSIGWCAAGAWTQPVHAPIVSGFRTPQRPGHDGVDLGAPRYTPIHAAAAGTVIVARCDHATGDCDHDGSPATPGCGWFVDIAHSGGIITRYCHMISQPLVGAGQHVDVGQILGLVGSSGHSSGPHLHFEVHLHGDRSAASAVDPVPFMAAVGAPLPAPG